MVSWTLATPIEIPGAIHIEEGVSAGVQSAPLALRYQLEVESVEKRPQAPLPGSSQVPALFKHVSSTQRHRQWAGQSFPHQTGSGAVVGERQQSLKDVRLELRHVTTDDQETLVPGLCGCIHQRDQGTLEGLLIEDLDDASGEVRRDRDGETGR